MAAVFVLDCVFVFVVVDVVVFVVNNSIVDVATENTIARSEVRIPSPHTRWMS